MSRERLLSPGTDDHKLRRQNFPELRHRGELLVQYPGAELWKAVGGSQGVATLIKELYRRIEQDETLREVFPHFNSGNAIPFFEQWFGGSHAYSDDLHAAAA